MPTSGPVRRGRSSTQIGEGPVRRGRVRSDQSRDADRIAQLEADNVAQQLALEEQAVDLANAEAAIVSLSSAILQLQTYVGELQAEDARTAPLRPQAVVCHHAGVTRAFVRRPGERWEPLRLATVLARASLRG
jgi:hypothetical protein